MVKIILLALVVLHTTKMIMAIKKVHGDAYLKHSAEEKSKLIWSNCQESQKSAKWFNAFEMGGLLLEDMCPSFNTKGDELPTSWWSNRKKYIHTVGAVGRVELKSVRGHEYTGIFKGASFGFARLSLAAKPSPSSMLTTPGMALKFLRNKIDSANLVAMYSVNGQKSWNFFKNDFSNHIGRPSGMALRILSGKFEGASNNVQQVGLSDFARYGEDGAEVSAPKFPYKLRFHAPNGSSKFPDEYRRPFTEDLLTIKKGSILYKVYALDKPTQMGGTEKHIADLILSSDLITSAWADKHMFFRHQDMAEDLILQDKWSQYTPAAKIVTPPKVKCPFH